MTRRRWIADTWDNTTAALEGDQARHLSRVLRAQPGMEFDVVAGGKAWLGRITTASDERVVFALVAEVEAAATLLLTLVLSVFKYDRMEWAIEKAVELGATRIIPAIAARTEKHLAQSAEKRTERWRRIAVEAAKQSRRSDLPTIEDPVLLRVFLSGKSAASLEEAAAEGEPGSPIRILLAETEQEQSLLRIFREMPENDRISEVQLAVGPEGGWSTAELEMFATAGWRSASLGPRILRVETAAVAALAIVNAIREG